MGLDLWIATDWKKVIDHLLPEECDYLVNNFSILFEKSFVQIDRTALEAMSDEDRKKFPRLFEALMKATEDHGEVLDAEIA